MLPALVRVVGREVLRPVVVGRGGRALLRAPTQRVRRIRQTRITNVLTARELGLLVRLGRAGIGVHFRRARAGRAGPRAHVVAAYEIVRPRARPERAAVLVRPTRVLHVVPIHVYSVARVVAAHAVRRLPVLAGELDREGAELVVARVVPFAGGAEEQQQQQGRVAPHAHGWGPHAHGWGPHAHGWGRAALTHVRWVDRTPPFHGRSLPFLPYDLRNRRNLARGGTPRVQRRYKPPAPALLSRAEPTRQAAPRASGAHPRGAPWTPLRE